MALGGRSARARHQAGVVSADYWVFAPGQRVMTIEGLPGVVTDVQDGPVPGDEAYTVLLDDGLGGGDYSPSELSPIGSSAPRTASLAVEGTEDDLEPFTAVQEAYVGNPYGVWDHGEDKLVRTFVRRKDAVDYVAIDSAAPQPRDLEAVYNGGSGWVPLTDGRTADLIVNADGTHTADLDYPELGDILIQRPPLQHSVKASLQAEAAKYQYRRSGNSTYEVHDPETGEHHGTVWRTRTGWSAKKPDGTVVVEDYPGSRDVAAGSLRREAGVIDTVINHWSDNLNNHLLPRYRYDPNTGAAPSYDWCRFRHNRRCMYPKQLDAEASKEAGYAVWVPTDRGLCPRDTWPQQEHCPLGEPGPHSGDPHALPDATVPWNEGGQRFSSLISGDSEFRWHFTSSWNDVRAKAKRIRSEGRVRIIAAPNGGKMFVTAEVEGDHNLYQSTIIHSPGTKNVGMWECGCAWASYSWGRSGRWKKYEGRMCSHALATLYEAQSQGMFGKEVREQSTTPPWRMDTTIPVLQPTNYPKPKRAASLGMDMDPPPITEHARAMLESGQEPNVVMASLQSFGMQVSAASQVIATVLKKGPFKAKVRGWVREVIDILGNGYVELANRISVPAGEVFYPTYDPRLGLDLNDSTPHISALDADVDVENFGGQIDTTEQFDLDEVMATPGPTYGAKAQGLPKWTYEWTYPDGTKGSMSSTRNYTHAVVVQAGDIPDYAEGDERKWYEENRPPGSWGVAAHTGSFPLAQQQRDKHRPHHRDAQIIEMDNPRPPEHFEKQALFHILSEADTKGVMVAFRPPEDVCEALAALGDEPVDQIHMTLAYLGSDIDPVSEEKLRGCVQSFAANANSLIARIGGFGVFHNNVETVSIALVDVPGIATFRTALTDALRECGVPAIENHGYTPHITLKYGSTDVPDEVPNEAKGDFAFESLILAIGGDWQPYPLRGLGFVMSDDALQAAAVIKEAFDPGEKRDPSGKWTDFGKDISPNFLTPKGNRPDNPHATEFSKLPKEWQDKISKTVADNSPDTDYQGKLTPERMVQNLELLYHHAKKDNPDAIQQGMTWYDDAHGLAQQVAKEGGITGRQATGIIASLSPNAHWEENKTLSHFVGEKLREDKPIDFSPEVLAAVNKMGKKQGVVLKNGDRISKLDPLAAAYAIYARGKYQDDLHIPGRLKNNGEPYKAMWTTGMKNIAKAVAMYRGTDPNDVLSGHKTRSFFNNIADPHDQANRGDVTMDVHALSAASHAEMSAQSKIVGKLFDTGSSVALNAHGAYAMYADAYRNALADLKAKGEISKDVTPSQFQAMIWLHWRHLTDKLDKQKQLHIIPRFVSMITYAATEPIEPIDPWHVPKGEHPDPDHDFDDVRDPLPENWPYEDDEPESESKHTADLHDEPEPALPETDGAEGDENPLAWLMRDLPAERPATASARTAAPETASDSDIAVAARQFLAKEGLKQFTPAEQRAIIDEGVDVVASNLDRLDIAGTHYESLEAALADMEDDESWMGL